MSVDATYNGTGNRRGMRIFVAAAATFAFMCAVGLVLLGNGLKEATCAVAKASVFLFVPLYYTAFKCLPACTARALRIAAVYSLCLCAICTIAADYMANNTLVAKPTITLAVVLAMPLAAIYIARFFRLFEKDATPPKKIAESAHLHSLEARFSPALRMLGSGSRAGGMHIPSRPFSRRGLLCSPCGYPTSLPSGLPYGPSTPAPKHAGS